MSEQQERTTTEKRVSSRGAGMTAVTVDEINIYANYPAIYLWNQPATSSNHTPAWDRFMIPDVM